MIKKYFLVSLILISHRNSLINCSEDDNDYKDILDIFNKPTDAIIEDTTQVFVEATSKKPSALKIKIKIDEKGDWEDEVCELHEKCVPYYLCKEDGSINSDGSLLIDERFDGGGESTTKTCPNLEQCCKRNSTLDTIELNPTPAVGETTEKTVPATVEEFITSYGTQTPSIIDSDSQVEEIDTNQNQNGKGMAKGKGKEIEKENIKEVSLAELKEQICGLDSVFHTPDQCGFHNKKGLGGVVKSMQGKINYAQFAEFPWMAGILVERLIDDKKKLVYQSGGSLIHPKVVLTSAHNIAGIDPKKIVVRAGEWETQSRNEICLHEERNVVKVIKHENFKRANLQYNLALLILNEEFPMSPFINTVCLPPKTANFDNQRCFSSGWGKDKFGKAGAFQAFLKKVELPIVSDSDCETKLRETRLGKDFKLHESMLCAGGEEGKDLCTGDGGSPLVCPIDESEKNYYQVGIVVGGIGCGAKDVPGFYTNIARFRDWIDAKMAAEKFETSYYTF